MKSFRPKLSPIASSSHPIGLAGRRAAMITPTAENGRYQAIDTNTSCQGRSQPGRQTELVATDQGHG
jgi:hypothetical protein